MSLEQEVELIRQFPIFSKIQPAMQKLLVFSSERLRYAAGQVMFNAGDMGDAAYIVIDGAIEISVPTPGGPIVVNKLGRNDIIGEIAIFGDVPRTATATALTPVETLKISKELFTKVIRENPDAALELIRVLAARLAGMTTAYRCTLVVSEDTLSAAGIDSRGAPLHRVRVRGRNERLNVYAVDDPRSLVEDKKAEIGL